ncbi:Acyl-CoA thioesterase I precursor [Rubripirellula lacrimiformis]|uniref:Acyl-CoA thioesterase I n=1 Tax=Rubripirellula lacrimiformis TaxID=1930273 RepID=A0A517NBW1_9BACT|nr:GDSL-type esterase/lipase family protein [Rubripirellula lacrimiformis]QDT04623.1 Acyl-CoA thioesterase I precursor [Rubripirellula lacrimiformis]
MSDALNVPAPDDQRSAAARIASLFRRVIRTLAIGSVLALSLLAFPSVRPWVIALWLAVHTTLRFWGRPGWFPLAFCIILLLVRLVPATPAMLVFGVVLTATAWIRFRKRHHPQVAPRQTWLWLLVLWLAWAAMLWEHHRIIHCGRPHFQSFADDATIVCIGDSLTDGMRPDLGYPDALDKMLTNPVINEGFSGIATHQGLDLMPRVLAHQPTVVVIELGGHDFLKGHSRASTKSNLIDMIDQCHANGAEVVLMEIPRGFMLDPFASLERQIAYEKDVELVADTWLRQIVLNSPIAPPGMWMSADSRLSDDGIHSNPKGSKVIAHRVAKAIESLRSVP